MSVSTKHIVDDAAAAEKGEDVNQCVYIWLADCDYSCHSLQGITSCNTDFMTASSSPLSLDQEPNCLTGHSAAAGLVRTTCRPL